MNTLTISPIASSAKSALIQTSAEGKLQERTLTKNPVRHLTSLFEKISRLFAQIIHWLKGVVERFSKPLENGGKKGETFPEIPLPPPDFSFLHPKDPAYNVKRLSEMSIANASQSVSTEAVFKSLPKTNPIRLGFEDPVAYQTHLGDQAVALHGAITALGITGISLGNIFACRASNRYPKFSDCVQSMATVWQEPAGQTGLMVSTLLFSASVYAHRKGWLGQILHDRSKALRERQIETLFRAAASELQNQAITNPKEALLRATKILQNLELIESSLHVDLQLSLEKAKAIRSILEQACERASDPDPAPVEPPPQSPTPNEPSKTKSEAAASQTKEKPV